MGAPRLKRSRGWWPAASVVRRLFGSWAAPRRAASADCWNCPPHSLPVRLTSSRQRAGTAARSSTYCEGLKQIDV